VYYISVKKINQKPTEVTIMTRAEMIEMHEEEVKKAIEKAIRIRDLHNGMEGWTIDIVMSNDGDITLEGLRDRRTCTRDEWEGRAFMIWSSPESAIELNEYIGYWDGFEAWREEHLIKDEDTVEEWSYEGENYDSLPSEVAQAEALESFYSDEMSEMVETYLEQIYEDDRNQEEI
jgi:hypothetical protein